MNSNIDADMFPGIDEAADDSSAPCLNPPANSSTVTLIYPDEPGVPPPPPPSNLFATFEDLFAFLQGFFHAHGGALTKGKSGKKRDFGDRQLLPSFRDLMCNRGVRRESSSAGIRKATSRKLDCPFKIRAQAYKSTGWKWVYRISEGCGYHDHSHKSSDRPPRLFLEKPLDLEAPLLRIRDPNVVQGLRGRLRNPRDVPSTVPLTLQPAESEDYYDDHASQPPKQARQAHAGFHDEILPKYPQRPMGPVFGAPAGHRGGPLHLEELSLPASKAISTTPPKPNAPPVEAFSHQVSDELSNAGSESRRQPAASAATNKRQTNEDILTNLLPKAVAAEASPDLPLAKSPQRVPPKTTSASPNGFANRHQHFGIKTPEMHDAGAHHIFRRSSPPTSLCGDLEGPAHRSPRAHQPAVQGPALLRTSPHFETVRRDRSQSRTSNISKKRSDKIRKHRRRTEDERKKKAMQHVAQYWNECIQISEEEKNHANREIESLQHQLQRQEAKLSESRSMLKRKQHDLECAESLGRQLQEEGLQIKDENRNLSEEVQTLRDQLSESEAHTAKLRERHRQIRDKLNEAIQEQQGLYKRSQAFYEDLSGQLRQEKEERETYTSRMDELLETSRHKREEMKQCFDDFRDKMERESRLKEETISELRGRVEEQEESLRHERELAESLSRQVNVERDSRDAIQATASNVESLLRDYAVKCVEQQGIARTVESISDRLDDLAKRMQNSEKDGSSSTAVTQAIQGMEEVIAGRVIAIVADMASGQGRIEETLLALGRSCGIQVKKLREFLDYHNEEMINFHLAEDKVRREFRGSLESIQSEVRQTGEETRQQIKEAFQDVARTELITRQEDICKQQAALNDESLQGRLGDVVAEVQNSLEQGFLKERNRSEEHLRQTQTAVSALESQLRTVVDHLEEAKLSAPRCQEPESVNHDGQAVDDLRVEFSELQRRVPQLERLGSTLSKMAQMNEILHSTAQFLGRERNWARQEIDKAADAGSRQERAGDGSHEISTVERDRMTGAQHGAALLRRRVMVYSPAGSQLSPSPPPSVEQEQARRRGAAQPRSILKLSAAVTSSLEPGTVDEQAMRAGPSRPVTGKDSVAAAASAMVEQIRAELLPSEASQLAWSLPSVADFERDGPCSAFGGSRGSVRKAKRGPEDADLASMANKRPRNDTEAAEADKGSGQESETE
ncbi:hypothetical protein CDD80_2627 [Ophiocordyceps camponoti-rufipedis]|uniref:Uncharacterized protein n=1 Tax=Ophiocordyceps camponoti-rufipedis TaxID=2004952 RepID=A0A2C5Z259_9HYPO|nr:hypothetical protein CDD80_2627 [Ophiocordyceps camponoti-rufipedis]